MPSRFDCETQVHAELSPELAAWLLGVAAKELESGRPRWARLDQDELTSFLKYLHDVVPVRYRMRVPLVHCEFFEPTR